MAMPAAAAAAAEPSPATAEGTGPAASGDSAAPAGQGGAADGMAGMAGMAGGPPGMLMWHPQMMMNPAMMQQFQMQQAAMLKGSEHQAGGKPGMAAAAPPQYPGAYRVRRVVFCVSLYYTTACAYTMIALPMHGCALCPVRDTLDGRRTPAWLAWPGGVGACCRPPPPPPPAAVQA